MKKSRFTESKIVNILKQQETGRTVQEICREYGISQATFFNWKSKYGGMSASHLKRLKELETENLRLKKMYADISLQNDALKDLIEKKL
jgi:putative transposase